MLKINKVLLHGLLLACLAVIPVSAFASNSANNTNDKIAQQSAPAGEIAWRHGGWGGRGYYWGGGGYYSPYYYNYSYPYYYNYGYPYYNSYYYY